MRKDERGNLVPATLAEYREFAETNGVKNNKAVVYLDVIIASSKKKGASKVKAHNFAMMALLRPMMQLEATVDGSK